jgi:UDP-N-acetylglucosamine--N-acetylmuramyl-(pentapeptide) pyrophosphoryl-undecaprenol N-acetylglucosamine transferase
MSGSGPKAPFVAIACGGTGGHLFPGLAVAEQLTQRGCSVALVISPKDVDQQAIRSVGVQASTLPDGAPKREPQPGSPMEIFTLPAVGLQNRNYFAFAGSCWKSFRAARKIFRQRKPDAVLAMGGFTSAPPVWVGRDLGARSFLHESNTIPGRANRLLARFVDEAFVGFPEAAARLKARKITSTGTPVRLRFSPDARHQTPDLACRAALGLDADYPTVLVVGGSQGAHGINEMILSALPLLAGKPWQWLHLTGTRDFEKVKAAYAGRGMRAVVKPFLAEMELALGAATAAVSRAGASSLAELAAVRLPALLVPFPAAADNHQFYNARALEATGAARLFEQKGATPEKVAAAVVELMENRDALFQMRAALARWHNPKAAEQIAENILSAVFLGADNLAARSTSNPYPPAGRPRSHRPEQEHFSIA